MAAAALLVLNALGAEALRQIKKLPGRLIPAGCLGVNRCLAITRSVRHMTCIGAPEVGAGL